LNPKVRYRGRPELPATGHERVARLGAGMKFTSLWAEETMMSAVIVPVGH